MGSVSFDKLKSGKCRGKVGLITVTKCLAAVKSAPHIKKCFKKLSNGNSVV